MRRAAIPLLVTFSVAAAPAIGAAATATVNSARHTTHDEHVKHARPPAHAARPVARFARPTARPDAFAAAPVPDQDADAPVSPEDLSAHIAPTMFHIPNDYRGDGYVYGSSPQGMDDNRALMVPGMKLSVPLP